MDPKWWIGIGLVAAALVGAGVYEHYKAAPATGGGGNLTPGALPGVTFSASACTPSSCPSATYTPPTGGSVTSAAQSGGGTTIQVSTSSGSAVLTAMAASPPGTTTVTIAWTDASGAQQSSTVLVTVTA